MGRYFAHDSVDRDRRKARMAQLVADGASIADARDMMSLTPGQASRLWQDIKAEMGAQAV